MSRPMVLVFLLVILIVTSQFEWKQQFVGETEASLSISQKLQRISNREEAVKEKMLMQLPQMGQLMEQHMCPHMVRHMHHAYMEQHMPPPQLWGTHTSPPKAGVPGYRPDPQIMPVRPHDYFYPPPAYRVAKPPHRRIFRDVQEAAPMGGHPSMNQPPQMSS